MSTTLFFPAAIEIDSHPVTDQGRSPITVTRDERSVIVELANGDRKRYIKAVKHQFAMSWTWLPDKSIETIDGGIARQEIQNLVGTSGEVHTLRFYDRNAGWMEYLVFVNTYSEILLRRDAASGTHFWEVTIELEES